MSVIGFLGYGRFGLALGTLLRESGHDVRAFDPYSSSGGDTAKVGSLRELVKGADFVVLAVPVPKMADAIEGLRPHVTSEQIVFDVGSLKVGPSALMATAFGQRIPWVATHPLFGPVSLACGERPLRTVVCPNAVHPDAVRKVVRLFEQIGCQVIEDDADTHDRTMAYTHALAFFVAKGMLDAGAPTQAPYPPPSYQAILRTIESVRADAGHLFVALHRENSYAADARKALLTALDSIDKSLAENTSDASATASLSIPDLGACSPDLRETRELIDELDRELIGLLARRARLSERAQKAKVHMGAGVRDPRREAALLEARRAEAERLGLDPAGIAEVFEAVLRFSRKIQGS